MEHDVGRKKTRGQKKSKEKVHSGEKKKQLSLLRGNQANKNGQPGPTRTSATLGKSLEQPVGFVGEMLRTPI